MPDAFVKKKSKKKRRKQPPRDGTAPRIGWDGSGKPQIKVIKEPFVEE